MTLNRKERRAQAKRDRKAHQHAAFLMQADGRGLTAWQIHDLHWFTRHPHCSYHLREPFPGEYEPEEALSPGVWFSLIKIHRVTSVFGVSRIEHCPLSPEPADGLNCVLAMQATTKGQEALRAIWNEYPQEVFSA